MKFFQTKCTARHRYSGPSSTETVTEAPSIIESESTLCGKAGPAVSSPGAPPFVCELEKGHTNTYAGELLHANKTGSWTAS